MFAQVQKQSETWTKLHSTIIMFYTELHVPDRLTNGDSHNVILPIYPMIHGKEPNDNLVLPSQVEITFHNIN